MDICSFIALLVSLAALITSRIMGIYFLRVIFKITSSLLFLAVAYFSEKKCQKTQRTTYYKFMFLGLFFSMLGDVSLVFNKDNGIFFILGLLGFACAHIFFTAGFFCFGKLTRINYIYITVFLAFLFVLISQKQWIELGSMKFLVIGYAVLLSIMAGKSFSVWTYRGENPYFVYLTIIGALLFLFSDCLLLFAFFGKSDLKFLETINNFIYYIGQGLFGLSFRKEFLLKQKNET